MTKESNNASNDNNYICSSNNHNYNTYRYIIAVITIII